MIRKIDRENGNNEILNKIIETNQHFTVIDLEDDFYKFKTAFNVSTVCP